MQRTDDFEKRRTHLKQMSDDELHAHFWNLVDRIILPVIEEAKTHTTPSIERSVLLRMGFSSMETKAIVGKIMEKGLLGHGAGKLVLHLARKKGISIREAGLELMGSDPGAWEEVLP